MFEKFFGPRRDRFDETKAKKYNMQEKIKDLESPIKDLGPSNPFADTIRETLNAVLSIPSIPERAILKKRVEMAQSKLERIKKQDEKEAYKLNEKYNEIIKKSIETGDDTERKEFEKNVLGIEDEKEKMQEAA